MEKDEEVDEMFEDTGEGEESQIKWEKSKVHHLLHKDVMERNITKLKARYGEKFTEEKANTRDLNTERQILEN